MEIETWSLEHSRKGQDYEIPRQTLGSNPSITRQFTKTLKNGSVIVGNQCMEITKDVITKSMGLEMEGINFFKDRQVSDRAIDIFMESN